MFLKLLGHQASSLLASQLLLVISWADTIEMSIPINTLSFQVGFRFYWWQEGTADLVISMSELLTEHMLLPPLLPSCVLKMEGG